jgi:hypothetical protein
VSSQHAVAMGNDKPKSLRSVENYLWKAFMNMALSADQHEQMQEFIQYTSNIGDIQQIEDLRWFVKSA